MAPEKAFGILSRICFVAQDRACAQKVKNNFGEMTLQKIMRPVLSRVLALCALAFCVCARSTHHEAMLMKSTKQAVPLVYVPETQALPGNFNEREITLPPEELARFARQWQQLKPRVRARVHADSLRALSRWAQAEMQKFSLPKDWLEKIPLRAMAARADERIVRFGQFTEEGLPLPAPRPLVFRRLVLFVDFDRDAQTIVHVIISINGWVEE